MGDAGGRIQHQDFAFLFHPAGKHLEYRIFQGTPVGEGEFTAFIPWTFQRENTALGRKITEEPTGIDYLQMLAVSRLYLDNIQHIQASWLTQGLKLGQTSLRFGADDMGSIMIEENVVSAAGAYNEANERDLRYQIREAGFHPQQRDILYNYINRDDIDEVDKSDSMKLKQLSVAFAD